MGKEESREKELIANVYMKGDRLGLEYMRTILLCEIKYLLKKQKKG